MAAGAILSKLLGALKSFLKSMTSPLGGYEIQDAKVNNKGGEYSVLYQFGGKAVVKGKNEEEQEVDNALMTESGEGVTDISGNAIQLNVLLSTVNVKTAIEPILSGLNDIENLYKSNPKEANNLLCVLLGEGRESGDDEADQDPEYIPESTQISEKIRSIFAVTDNSLAAAQSKGTGLLGAKLDTNGALPSEAFTFEGKQWSWEKIAGDYLKYALECAIPDNDYGTIENVSLSKCSDLISEYLMKMNQIQNKDEVKIDVVNLVRPILIRLQSDLADYYSAAYEKYASIKEVKDTSAEDKAQAEAEAKQAEEDAKNAEAEQQQQINDNLFKNTNNAPYRPGVSQSQAQGVFPGMSKQISVTLKKIQGSTAFDLLALKSNYSPTETLDDLDDVVIQDEFINSLTEEPQSFNISVDDDGYDISTCETCMINPCESLEQVFKCGVVMYRNLYILHWMAKGNDMMKLHLLAEEMYGELIQEIDTLGELLVEKCGTIPTPDWCCEYVDIKPYEFQESLKIISGFVTGYINMIDYAYPNQTSDVQSIFDEWLRYWNKQLNYFVGRQEI